eukprot:10317218-Alexandrium_andersonii.AAC.1
MPHVQRPAARCLGAKTAADSPSQRLLHSVARPLTVAAPELPRLHSLRSAISDPALGAPRHPERTHAL